MFTPLTDSPADIIRKLLVDLSLAVEPTFTEGRYTAGAWPAFAHNEPSFPDQCITVRETDAIDDGPDMHGNLYFHYGCQIRFRAITKNAVMTKARAVQGNLFSPTDPYDKTVTISGRSYEVHCVIPGPVLDLGMNVANDKRLIVTLNVLVPIRAL